MSPMNKNEGAFNIHYPALHPGAAETVIDFHFGKPNLFDCYTPGKERGRRLCFVTDATVATLPETADFFAAFDDGRCGDDLLIILGSGEPYKTIDSVLRIIHAAVEAGFSRKDAFVGIGGGVICDITGFAASVFKRGAAVSFVPTTLLSMVDASIGGKTGFDFSDCKNMVGAFFPAEQIDCYPEFVHSLPPVQYRSGLAEALKNALLYDRELFTLFQNESKKILSQDPDTVYEIIKRSAAAKAAVVEKDFTEQNIRMHLNFGHTFAHALESLAGLGTVAHGDAVAWGMGRALELCAQKGFCTKSYRDEIFRILETYGWVTDAAHPLVIGGGIGKRLLEVMHKDKKNTSPTVRLVLQRGLNDTFTAEIEDGDILAVLERR